MDDSSASSSLISLTKAGCFLSGNWPLKPGTPKWKCVLSKVMYWMHFSNQLYATMAILNGLFCCFSGASNYIKSLVEITFMVETLFNLIYFQWRASQIERLAFEMEDFFETAAPQARIARLKYLNRMRAAYYVPLILYLVSAVLFAFAPVFSDVHLTPVNTVYFLVPRETTWGRSVTYALDILHIFNASSVIFLDLLTISILNHAGGRFKAIGIALRTIKAEKIKAWIMEHQKALGHANEVNTVLAPIAMRSTISATLYIVVSGLLIIHNIPFVETTKFLLVTVFSLSRFLGCSWAADTMTEEGLNVAWEIYDTAWFNAQPRVRNTAIITINMCQKPTIIRTGGFLTAWSLRFCGQVLYTSYAFFSTMRAILHV